MLGCDRFLVEEEKAPHGEAPVIYRRSFVVTFWTSSSSAFEKSERLSVYQSCFDAWTCDHSLCISIAFDVWSFVIIIIFHYPLSFIIMYHYLSSLFIIIIICYDSSSILMIYHHFHTWLSFIKMNFSARRTPRFIIISLIMHHKCH